MIPCLHDKKGIPWRLTAGAYRKGRGAVQVWIHRGVLQSHISSDSEYGATRWYWGVNAVIGYEFAKGICMDVEYDMSMTANQGERMGVFIFGVGYMFEK